MKYNPTACSILAYNLISRGVVLPRPVDHSVGPNPVIATAKQVYTGASTGGKSLLSRVIAKVKGWFK